MQVTLTEMSCCLNLANKNDMCNYYIREDQDLLLNQTVKMRSQRKNQRKRSPMMKDHQENIAQKMKIIGRVKMINRRKRFIS